MAATLAEARAIAAELPRSSEGVVRGSVRFRVGRLVYAAFDADATIMGFGFPKEEREALVASEPDKFLMPRPSDMRYQWACVRLAAIDVDELRELLVDAWRMCVPKKVAAAFEGGALVAGLDRRQRDVDAGRERGQAQGEQPRGDDESG